MCNHTSGGSCQSGIRYNGGMILEAFSDFLKQYDPPGKVRMSHASVASRQLLEGWLKCYLCNQVILTDMASVQLSRCIQTEFTLIGWQGKQWIAPTSTSGQKLLTTLQHYADSYDQWQFARFVHKAHASDFAPQQ